MWVRICRFKRDGLSKAFVQTLQGNKLLSLGLALGVGTLGSGRSPCELAAELSPDTDFPSSSPDGGELGNALDSNDIDKSSGESAKFNKSLLRNLFNNKVSYNNNNNNAAIDPSW